MGGVGNGKSPCCIETYAALSLIELIGVQFHILVHERVVHTRNVAENDRIAEVTSIGV